MFSINKIEKRLDNEKILILVDGWGFNKYFYFLIKKFIPKCYGYIHYSYSDEILNQNPDNTKNNIKKLTSLIENDVNNLILIKPRLVYLYGQSLGGLFCLIVVDKIKTKKVMLVAPGCNLAEAFWLGEYTQEIKNKMIKESNMSLEKLKNDWQDISPDFYFKNNSLSSNFFIIMSKKDRAIPISNGKKFIDLLNDKNIMLKIKWSNLSHRSTLVKELIFIKNFRKWILDLY